MLSKNIQTDCREEVCQTDPYSPEEIITENCDQELLDLKTFKYGDDLPAGYDQLMFIQKLREQRKFEDSLPPFSDESNFFLWKKLLTWRENLNYRDKIEQLNEQQKTQLTITRNLITQREEIIDENMRQNQFIVENKDRNAIQKKQETLQLEYQNKARKIVNSQQRFLKTFSSQFKIGYQQKLNTNSYQRTIDGLFVSKDQISQGENIPETKIKQMDYEELQKFMEKQKQNLLTKDQWIKQSEVKYNKQQLFHKNLLFKNQNNSDQNKDDLNDADQLNEHKFQLQQIIPWPQTPVYDKRPELQFFNNNFQDKEKLEEYQRDLEIKEELTCFLKFFEIQENSQRMYEELGVQKEKRRNLIQELLIVSQQKEQNQNDIQDPFEEYKVELTQQQKVDQQIGQFVSRIAETFQEEFIRNNDYQQIQKFIKENKELRAQKESVEMGKRQAEVFLKRKEEIMISRIIQSKQQISLNILSKAINKSAQKYVQNWMEIQTKINSQKTQQEIALVKNDNSKAIQYFLYQNLIPDIQRYEISDQTVQQNKSVYSQVKIDSIKELKEESQNKQIQKNL